MRRLPVYFLLDTSGSMHGEPIHALNNAMSGMINTLRTDPQAIDSLWVSIITFNKEVENLVELTDLASFQLPEIQCPKSGPTHTGKALEVVYDRIQNEVFAGTSTRKGDWKPLIFLFTDGKPSDLLLYRSIIPKIKSLNLGALVCCAAGSLSNTEILKELSDDVVQLDSTDPERLKQFFKWVSETIEVGNKSVGTNESVELPPPPIEVHLVV